ncbi:Hypothetical predicted protein [Paramuricea clavata]|uniref:Uncharacterized protein n=1 Tax=Paramuricea clavata TaxID=317549 RepID=A0A6S7K1R9_PARCT|nr:Hypothetical predicted protein [Paramuricea clavata]
MVKVLMSQQESAFKSLLDSLIKSTIARVDGLVKEVADLKASLEYSQKDIAESGKSIKQNEKTIAAITVELTSTKTILDKCHNKATYLENQSRRNNIRVIGIQEKAHETWEESEAAVKSALVEKLNLPFQPRIERAHRTGKFTNHDGTPRNGPRPIICKLYDWKEKEIIIRNQKASLSTKMWPKQPWKNVVLKYPD